MLSRAEIVEPRIVELAGVPQQADGATLGSFVQVAQRLGVLRAVVDDDDLELVAGVDGVLLDAGEARLKQIEPVLGRDDDAD